MSGPSCPVERGGVLGSAEEGAGASLPPLGRSSPGRAGPGTPAPPPASAPLPSPPLLGSSPPPAPRMAWPGRAGLPCPRRGGVRASPSPPAAGGVRGVVPPRGGAGVRRGGRRGGSGAGQGELGRRRAAGPEGAAARAGPLLPPEASPRAGPGWRGRGGLRAPEWGLAGVRRGVCRLFGRARLCRGSLFAPTTAVGVCLSKSGSG